MCCRSFRRIRRVRSCGPVEIAAAGRARDLPILADERAAQERRFHSRRELDAFKRRIARRGRRFARADGPEIARDEREIGVEVERDASLGVQEKFGRLHIRMLHGLEETCKFASQLSRLSQTFVFNDLGESSFVTDASQPISLFRR